MVKPVEDPYLREKFNLISSEFKNSIEVLEKWEREEPKLYNFIIEYYQEYLDCAQKAMDMLNLALSKGQSLEDISNELTTIESKAMRASLVLFQKKTTYDNNHS